MPNKIQIKRSSAASATPTGAQLDAGELAINTADGRLYAKNSAGTVVNLPVASISGQTITPGQVNVDNLRLDANTLSSTDTNGNIIVAPNGTGEVLLGRTDGAHLSIHADNTNNAVQLKSSGTSAGSFSFFSGNTERFAMAANGALSVVVPGNSTLLPMFACRAWVNFNGTANSNATGTYSQSGTTVTVTITSHGLVAGESIYLDFTSGTATDAAFTVATVPTANTFTVTRASATTSGNVTLVKNTIRASGNVSSVVDNGTGDYIINFSTAMPDANYAAVATAGGTAWAFLCRTYDDGTARTTTALRIACVTLQSGNTQLDPAQVSVAIFR